MKRQGIRSKTATAYRLLGNLLSQKDGLAYLTPTETRTLRKLVAAGLVEVYNDGHHSVSLLGRAHYIARMLDLGFHQFCYLALLKREMKNPFLADLQGCDCREVDNNFAMLFPDVKAARVRSKLIEKQFIQQRRVWHFMVKARRFAELESHAEILEMFCKFIEEQTERAAKETLSDPEFAKMFQTTP
jgi:hypothetical protein